MRMLGIETMTSNIPQPQADHWTTIRIVNIFKQKIMSILSIGKRQITGKTKLIHSQRDSN